MIGLRGISDAVVTVSAGKPAEIDICLSIWAPAPVKELPACERSAPSGHVLIDGGLVVIRKALEYLQVLFRDTIFYFSLISLSFWNSLRSSFLPDLNA
jgi:hypothetical protein